MMAGSDVPLPDNAWIVAHPCPPPTHTSRAPLKALMHDCTYEFRVFVRALQADTTTRGVKKQAPAPDGRPAHHHHHHVRGNEHKVLTTTLGPSACVMEGFLGITLQVRSVRERVCAKECGWVRVGW
jgi:hypothetical protein